MGFLRPAAAAASGVADGDDLGEPLLLHNMRPSVSLKHTGSKPRETSETEAPVDLGWQFICRLCRILQAVHAAPALSLLVLSVAEAIIVSKTGTISGMFYETFVDQRRDKVLHLMLWSAGCYTATAVFYTVKVSLQDFFAWRWRASLTCRLQQAYCSNLAFYKLKGIDNPDQRLAQDLPLLTSSLADTLSVLAAAPFNVMWYTRLTHQVFGSWYPVVAAYLFFLAGAVIQRLVMLPVANTVFRQEAAEGGYRYKHMRFRTSAEQIALYRSAPTEHHHLTLQLSSVLACQGRLLLRRAVLTTATKLLEYGGLIVNFGCLAGAVFSGAWDSERSTAGGIAAKVSVASFYLLTLIYSFTQVLDLASKVSNLAGLTARVSQLWEQLILHQHNTSDDHHHHQQQQQQVDDEEEFDCNSSAATHSALQHQQQQQQQQQQEAARTSHELEYQQQQQQQLRGHQQQYSPQALQLLGDSGASFSHKRYASQAVTLQQTQLLTVIVPVSLQSDDRLQQSMNGDEQPLNTARSNESARQELLIDIEGDQYLQQQWCQQQQQEQTHHQQQQLMQVSVHSLGSDVLMNEVRRAFPDCPRLAPLTAVVTFQFCGKAQQIMLQQYQWQQQQPPDLQQQQQHNLQQRQHQRQLMLSSSNDSAGDYCGAGDMAMMLEVFLHWQAQMQSCLAQRGYWCDAINPRTGRALHGTAGAGYDEVIGAQVLLGYHKQQQEGGYHLISHPLAGTQVYPATLFTSAPLPLIRDALAAAAAAAGAGTNSQRSSDSGSPATPAAAAAAPTYRADSTAPESLLLAVPGDSSRAAAAPTHAAAGADVSSVPVAPTPGLASRQQLSPAQPRQPSPTTTATVVDPSTAADRPFLSCKGLTVSTPAGVLIVSNLTYDLLSPTAAATAAAAEAVTLATVGPRSLPASTSNSTNSCTPPRVSEASNAAESNTPGVASLLIQGPSGCGKSTLLKCLAGLWPADAGMYLLAPAAAATGVAIARARLSTLSADSSKASRPTVMFIPQTMLAAPGNSLREQLAYPAAAWACCCLTVDSSSCSSGCSTRRKTGVQTANSKLGGEGSRGRLAYGDCVVAINDQQQQQVPAMLSWWEDWLTCGVLHYRRNQQLQQQQQQQVYCSVDQSIKHQHVPCSSVWQAAQDKSNIHHRHHHQQQQQQLQPASAVANMKHQCSSCQELLLVLQQVGLGYMLNSLPAGLDSAAEDWGSVLSPGEQQRLAFARLLLHKPLLAVLDEATSSIPDAAAVELYRALQQSGIDYVSVGHSSSLRGVHDRVCHIVGDGSGEWLLL